MVLLAKLNKMSIIRPEDGALDKVVEALNQISSIPELTRKYRSNFKVGLEQEIIGQLISYYDVLVVGGAFFGDEGKGKTIDAIARHPGVTMVARVNSGSNAGHSIEFNGKTYIFHITPSSILVDGVTNYIGSECVVDPIEYLDKEISKLAEDGISYKERLFIGNVHVVTPYHKLMDVLRNLGDDVDFNDMSSINLNNASTLKGIAPVHSSKVTKNGPRLDDIFGNQDNLKKIIEKDMKAYKGMLLERGISQDQLMDVCDVLNSDDIKRVPDHVMEFLKAENKADFLVDLYQERVANNQLFPERRNVKHEIRARLENGEKLLVEGPQSYFLSNNIESHWSSSTSACTTAAGIIAAAGINIQNYKIGIINVHKAPGSSRVGRGANPAGYVPQTFFSDQGINSLNDLPKGACEDFDAIQKQFFESVGANGILQPTIYSDSSGKYPINVAMAIAEAKLFKECGSTTKKPRVTGLFDCVAHAEVMREQGPYTSISALDRGDHYDKLGLVVAYAFHHPDGKKTDSNGKTYKNGDIIRPNDPYPNENTLKHCHPIIKVVEGWKDSPIAADKFDGKTGLPKGVQDYLGTITALTGATILSVGNGPKAENLIYIKKQTLFDSILNFCKNLFPSLNYFHK